MLLSVLLGIAAGAQVALAASPIEWTIHRPSNTGFLGITVRSLHLDDADGFGWMAPNGGILRYDRSVGPDSLVRFDSSNSPTPTDWALAPDGTIWAAMFQITDPSEPANKYRLDYSPGRRWRPVGRGSRLRSAEPGDKVGPSMRGMMAPEFSAQQLEALRDRARVLAELARAEDLAQRGDITSALVDGSDKAGRFGLVARQAGVFAGGSVLGEIVGVFDSAIQIVWDESFGDGGRFEPGQVLARLKGPVRSILTVERSLLNFLQRLCGVATATRGYVDAVAGTGAEIFDTRKTIPGWRLLDKYAVRCGGGFNHRMGLHDAVLIKDNHLAGVGLTELAGWLFERLNGVATLEPQPGFVEVEADTLEQVEQLFKVVGIDAVLLDNFGLDDLRRAVGLRDDLGLKGKVALEASGGVTLEAVRSVALTGVDRISVGAITHSVLAVDLGLDEA